MLNIFTDNWENPPILNDGERMLQLFAGLRGDAYYVIVDDSLDDDELDDEICRALRHKFGMDYAYAGFKDASYICEDWADAQKEADGAWDGEGYYLISWSDGGMDWTNDGPIWCGDTEDLATEVWNAYEYKTKTHIPCAERVKEFHQYELDALLGDFANDYDIEAIIDAATKVTNDGNRYWVVDEDELNGILESCEKDDSE